MLLKDISDILTGLVVQRKAASHPKDIKKSYKLLTLRSLEDDGWINDKNLENFESNEVLDNKYITKHNDLVIRLSFPYTCVKITKEYEGLLVPSQFALIRIYKEEVVPGYISFLLNASQVQKKFIRTSLGATIPVIRVGTLRNTEISFPKFQVQKHISDIHDLAIRKNILYQNLYEQNSLLNDRLSKKILKDVIK